MKTSKMFVYCLITKDMKDDLTRIYALKDIPNITLYGMPEENPSKDIFPERWQKDMAQKYIYSGQWRKISYEEWLENHKNDYAKSYYEEIKNDL